MYKLHAYQEKAVQFCLRHKRVYLAVDLGMGKTAIALETIKRSGQKAFVFGPLRTIYSSWPDEIAKWAPELSYYILHGPDKSLVIAMEYDIILMNYEGLPWLAKQNAKWRKRMVVFDESSMVKSHSTKRFGLLKKMKPLWSEYAICMSATPAPNALTELWSQYFLLDGGERLGKNITAFREKYCSSFSYPGMTVTLYTVEEDKIQDVYKAIAPITYRLEASDYLSMPPISYNKISGTLSKKDMKSYRDLEQWFFLELDELQVEAPNTAILGMKLRQFIQGGLYDEEKQWHEIHTLKLKMLEELVDTAAGRPILCAIQFKGELTTIRKKYPEAPVIAGGTPAKMAQEYITRWNSGQVPLLLCHPASISHGVNLQHGGCTLLWYGLPWSLEQYLQLNGRLYRQGQEKPVVIHHLVISETIDEVILEALTKKNTSQRALLDYLKTYRRTKK